MLRVNQLTGFGGQKIVPVDYGTDFALVMATTGAAETVTIPCRNVGTFNAEIDWGDETTSTITTYNDADLAHEYADAGDHTIRISGAFPNIYFNNGGDKLKVKKVLQFGDVGWTNLDGAFYGCTNLTEFTAGTTDTSSAANISNMFRGCSGLLSVDISSFVLTASIALTRMFNGCTNLATITVTNWGTTATLGATSSMFEGCVNLASIDLTGLNTSGVASMSSMFRQCTSLTSLDVTGFNTSSVIDLNRMFSICSSLTSLDVSGFNTSLVANLRETFWGCSGLTDIIGVEDFDIEGLDFTGDLDNFATNVTLPTSRYDALLINWDAQDPFDGMSPNFGGSKYTDGGAAAAARANLIATDGWVITDGGTA